jgi:hypothetical protein
MKRFVRATAVMSFLAATVLGGSAAMAQMGAPPSSGGSAHSNSASSSEKVSKDVAVPLEAAQKAFQAGDMPTAMAQIKLAQAVSDRTPYDDYVTNRFLAAVSANMKDYATSAQAFNAVTASPELAKQPDADKMSIYHDALIVNGNVQRWQDVITDGQQLEALKGNDDATLAELAIAYYNLKDLTNAQTYAQQSIDRAKSAGKQPEQAALQIVMNSEAKSNNQSAAIATLETMAVSYNDPNTWHQLTGVALGTKNLKEIDALYIYRLRFSIGAMSDTDDFTVTASLANQLGYPTEALKVLEQGINSGKLSSGQAGSELSKARSGSNEDSRQLAALTNAAQQAKSGEAAVKQAEDYWGYGRYADAETFARLAIAKGGMKDPSEGNMILGLALVAQNKYDDAIVALGQVSGSEGRSKAAHLWSLYAQAKKKQAGGSAPPAPAPAH